MANVDLRVGLHFRCARHGFTPYCYIRSHGPSKGGNRPQTTGVAVSNGFLFVVLKPYYDVPGTTGRYNQVWPAVDVVLHTVNATTGKQVRGVRNECAYVAKTVPYVARAGCK